MLREVISEILKKEKVDMKMTFKIVAAKIEHIGLWKVQSVRGQKQSLHLNIDGLLS